MGSFIMILFSCLICFIKPLLLRFRENQRCSCFIKTLCWIANKLYCIMIFGYFIRNILEMSQFILISSINEVYDSNTENAYRLTSFIYSVLMILIFILIAILIIYLTFSSYKLDHSKHNKLEEIFRGLQQDKKHRLYVSLLLLRRLIFVILLVTWMKISSRTLTIILTIIQALYTICLSYLRPYKETKGNIIEILNEIYFGFLILFLTFTNTEDEWNSVKTSIYMWVLVTNTFIVFIIVLGKTWITIFSIFYCKYI